MLALARLAANILFHRPGGTGAGAPPHQTKSHLPTQAMHVTLALLAFGSYLRRFAALRHRRRYAPRALRVRLARWLTRLAFSTVVYERATTPTFSSLISHPPSRRRGGKWWATSLPEMSGVFTTERRQRAGRELPLPEFPLSCVAAGLA